MSGWALERQVDWIIKALVPAHMWRRPQMTKSGTGAKLEGVGRNDAQRGKRLPASRCPFIATLGRLSFSFTSLSSPFSLW